jgi:RNA polymerase sigma-70 factor (ECF subfamily)
MIDLRKGDLDAFRRVYSKYKYKVFFFSLSYLKSREKAEDIVQDVFIKVWENRNHMDEHYSFSNFPFTVTKNTILNHIRKKKYEIVYRGVYK